MKKSVLGVLVLIALGGCASMQEQAEFDKLAGGVKLTDMFPTYWGNRFEFDTLDEAYKYVGTATARLGKSTNLHPSGGLSGRVSGPEFKGDKPVVVYSNIYDVQVAVGNTSQRLTTDNFGKEIDFNKDAPDEKVLANTICAVAVYLVFYGDRAVMVTNKYIKEGWNFSTNFTYDTWGNYEVQYPVGWGKAQAFQYLNHERD